MYARGDIILLSNINIDKCSVFKFVRIRKEDVETKRDFKLWWNGAYARLKELVLDSHVIEVLNFGLSQNFVVKVYVEKLKNGFVVVSMADVVNVVDVEKVVGARIVKPKGVGGWVAEVEVVGNGDVQDDGTNSASN